MMLSIKKTFIVAVIIFSLIFISLMTRCTSCTGEYVINPGELTVMAEDLFPATEDSITGNDTLLFYYAGHGECVCKKIFRPTLFISTANATSPCDRVNITKFNPERTRFTINKAFYFNGDTIPAGTNLKTHPVISKYLHMPDHIERHYQEVWFENEFYSDSLNLSFSPGNYTFSFRWESMQGDAYEGEVAVYVDLGY